MSLNQSPCSDRVRSRQTLDLAINWPPEIPKRGSTTLVPGVRGCHRTDLLYEGPEGV